MYTQFQLRDQILPSMDNWNPNLRSFPFVSQPQPVDRSLTFLRNFNSSLHPHFPNPGKQPLIFDEEDERSNAGTLDERKKRLSNEQVEELERSFEEEIKLEPERKMKLAKQLGLQPRQIAVWFQNRRARWKAKQLQLLYDALKLEFDNVSRDKHNLQQEVLALRAMLLKEQASKKQVSSTAYTEVSGEETVESTSINPSFRNPVNGVAVECNSSILMNMDDYNPAMMMTMMSPPCHWDSLPSCPN